MAPFLLRRVPGLASDSNDSACRYGFVMVIDFLVLAGSLVDFASILDQLSQSPGCDGLFGIIANAVPGIYMAFNAESIGAIGHSGHGGMRDVNGSAHGMGWIHHHRRPVWCPLVDPLWCTMSLMA